MKKFTYGNFCGDLRFLMRVDCLSEVFVKKSGKTIRGLFLIDGVDEDIIAGCVGMGNIEKVHYYRDLGISVNGSLSNYSYYYNFLKLWYMDGLIRCGFVDVIDFGLSCGDVRSFVGFSEFGLMRSCGDLTFVENVVKKRLGLGCFESFVIGLVDGSQASINYWNLFRKYLVGVGILKVSDVGEYLGFDYEFIDGLFENEFGVGGSFDVDMSMNDFFSYGLIDNRETSMNWRISMDSLNVRKLNFVQNLYMDRESGELLYEKKVYDGLKLSFLKGDIGECEFIEKKSLYGGNVKSFFNGIDALRVDEFCKGLVDCIEGEEFNNTIYRNRLNGKYISYSRIAELLGLNSKIAAWYMMQNQSMVILRNDRIKYSSEKAMMVDFGLGIQEVLSESDIKKKKKKKDDDSFNEGGQFVEIGDDNPIIKPFCGGIFHVDEILITEKNITEKNIQKFDLDDFLVGQCVEDSISFVEKKSLVKTKKSSFFESDLLQISEIDILNSVEKVVYYDSDEQLTECELFWVRAEFGSIVDGMSHAERNEIFRCMMNKDKDRFGSFNVRRYLYSETINNPVWYKLFDAEVVRRTVEFKSNGQYFRWNGEFLKSGCLVSKQSIDDAIGFLVDDCFHKDYFDEFGILITKNVVRKKLVSEFGLLNVINKLMHEASVIGIENFRKSRGLSIDFNGGDVTFVEDFNDVLKKMYLPCRVYRNKKGSIEVNYISEINRIGSKKTEKDFIGFVENSFLEKEKYIEDSLQKEKYTKEEYTKEVRKISERSYNENTNLINPKGLIRSVIDSEFTCQLDHKISISSGFERRICPSVIGSKENLQVLSVRFNQIKGDKNCMTLAGLKMEIEDSKTFENV